MNIGIDVDGVLIDFEERFRYKAEIFDYLEKKNNEVKDKAFRNMHSFNNICIYNDWM